MTSQNFVDSLDMQNAAVDYYAAHIQVVPRKKHEICIKTVFFTILICFGVYSEIYMERYNKQ